MLKITAVPRVPRNALEQHQSLMSVILGGPSLCSLRKGLLSQHGPEPQDASIAAMPSYLMDGNVFLPVCDVNQDIPLQMRASPAAVKHCRSTLQTFADSSTLQFEKLLCIALLADCTWCTCWSWHDCYTADPLASYALAIVT